MVWTALEAAQALEKEGIPMEVVDLRSLLPYDEEAVLASVRQVVDAARKLAEY
jgi:pyruvate/2-oxoglutarate/acetoin dehydrogenase E1 component